MLFRRQTRLLFLIFTLGCSPTQPPVVFTSEEFELRTDHFSQICAGTTSYMRSSVLHIQEQLGVAPDEPITYIWEPEFERYIELVGGTCGGIVAFGCARNSTVYSTSIPNTHEFVHAVANEYGSTHALLREGLAVSLGGAQRVEARIPCDNSYADILASGLNGNPDYGRAGKFAHFIIETYGIEKFVDLYRQAERDMAPETFIALIEGELGTSWSELTAHIDGCTPTSIDREPFECFAATPIQWDDTSLIDVRTQACHDSTSIGLESSYRSIRTFDTTNTGTFHIEAMGDPGTVIRIQRCENYNSQPTTLSPGQELTLEITPGRYAIRHDSTSSPASSGVTFTRE